MSKKLLWAAFPLLFFSLLTPLPSVALLSDPPHLIFGTIHQEGVPVLTGTVRAMRQGQTNPVATYEMGSISALGSLYLLRIPMDSLDPQVPGTCRPGDVLSILVGDRTAAEVTVGARGAVQRRDLALASLHQITFTVEPQGTPDPVASGGMVTVSATAHDSSGHQLTYAWSASCPGLPSNGTFTDPALHSTTWYASPNLTGSAKTCTIALEVTDGFGLSLEGSFEQTVSAGTAGTHTITIVSGPGGSPNPVATGGTVSMSVIAQDSLGHALGYYWVAACPSLPENGSFDDPTSRTPVWTAPQNTTTALQNCNVMVTANDGLGLSGQGFYLQGVRAPVHGIVVSDGPAGSPNPVSSGGRVNLSVTAQDTMGHPIGYTWSAQCSGLPSAGSFSNPSVRTPVWTAPVNDSSETRPCTLRVAMQDGQGVTEERSFLEEVIGARPVAVAAADPLSVDCAEEIAFNSAGSTHPDPAHRIVGYEWDFEYDGSRFDVDGRGAAATHAYGNLGDHRAALRAVDDCRPPHSSVAEVNVTVRNRAPQAVAGGPYAIAVGDPLLLDGGHSYDPDKGCGDAVAELHWDLDADGNFDDVSGPSPLLSWGDVLARVCGGLCDPAEIYPLALEVSDNSGLTADAAASLTVSALNASVKLISPNGGETLGNGSIWPVRWLSEGGVESVTVLLSLTGGRTWMTAIATADAAAGTADFLVPENIKTTQHKALMRIVGYASGAAVGSDTSDGYFAVGPLDVRAPERGAVLVGGDPMNITWDRFATAAGVASTKIMYTLNGGVSWARAATVAGNPGSYTWKVPAVRGRSDRCGVRVVLLGATGAAVGTDTGEGYFTILGALDILGPERGDLVYGGTSRLVTWQTRTGAAVASAVVRYTLDGGTNWKVGGKVAGNPGAFSWNVPVVLAQKARSRIKVTLLDKGGRVVAEDSGQDFFTVLPRP